MIIQTFKGYQGKTEPLHGVDQTNSMVLATFTNNDYMENAAHVRMTPSEARELAKKLVENADRLDPKGEGDPIREEYQE